MRVTLEFDSIKDIEEWANFIVSRPEVEVFEQDPLIKLREKFVKAYEAKDYLNSRGIYEEYKAKDGADPEVAKEMDALLASAIPEPEEEELSEVDYKQVEARMLAGHTEPESDLDTLLIPTRAKTALKAAGIYRVANLEGLTVDAISELPGIGKKTAEKICLSSYHGSEEAPGPMPEPKEDPEDTAQLEADKAKLAKQHAHLLKHPESEPEAEAEEAKPEIDKDELADMFNDLLKKQGGILRAKQLLQELGANRFGDVKPEQYAAFANALEASLA